MNATRIASAVARNNVLRSFRVDCSSVRRAALETLETRRVLATPDGPLPSVFAPTDYVVRQIIADTHRNRVYIADYSTPAIHVIDTDTGRFLKKIPLAGSPNRMAETPDGTGLVITLPNSTQVQVISLTSLTSQRLLNVGVGLGDIAVGADGVFYADHSVEIGSVITQYDLLTGASRGNIATRMDYDYAFSTSPDGTRLNITSDGTVTKSYVDAYDTTHANAVQKIATANVAHSAVVDNSTNRVFTPDESASDGRIKVHTFGGTRGTLWTTDEQASYSGFESPSIALAAHTPYVYSTAMTPAICVFSQTTGKEVTRYGTQGEVVADTLAITPNGHIMYASSFSNSNYVLGLIGSQTLTLEDSPPQVAGTVFNDVNLDGKRNPGEKRYLDAVIYLDLDNDGAFDKYNEPYAGAEKNGQFHLDLPEGMNGRYAVRLATVEFGGEHLPLMTSRASAQRVKIVDGIPASGVVLGATYPASLTTRVFFDEIGNGIALDSRQDAVPVIYLDANNNGIFDANEPMHNAGDYSEFLVAPGTYTPRLINPSKYTLTTAPFARVVLKSDDRLSVTIGVKPLRTMRGTIFHDLNRDGSRSSDEAAFAGARVWLDYNSDGRIDENEPTTRSTADGRYKIVGRYSDKSVPIRFSLADRRLQSTARRTRVHFADPATTIRSDFGLYDPTNLSVFLFTDQDRNRRFTRGDHGLAGVVVFLDDDNDGKQDRNERFAITNDDGNANFIDLTLGTYAVRVRVPSAMRATTAQSFLITLKATEEQRLNVGLRATAAPRG